VNWQHLQVFLWLRWRLLVNQWRRSGAVNAVLMTIFAVAALALAVPLCIACFGLGLYLFPKATPRHLLYAWDGMVVGFVFFWLIGLLTELQRTETLSLSKFLHLPVTVKEAFLINYVSSLLSLSLVLFVPLLIGFGLALVFAKGMLLLTVLPLSAAFLLMVTALTYQFQGWLASLMSNPRRRRTVVVAMTAIFVLIFQLPNLLNLYRPWGAQQELERSRKLVEELATLDRALQSHEIDPAEYARRQQAVTQRHELETAESGRKSADRWERTARLMNLLLPIGWLPLGVMSAAQGNLVPAVLGFLGMTTLGAASLWRAYRTTIRLYQGQFTAPQGRPARQVRASAGTRKPRARLLETRLPGLSEPVSAIALAGLRSLLRAPEAKMMLLTPVIMGFVFGSVVLKLPNHALDSLRPLAGIFAIALALFGMMQLMGNQFGFDRDGFRVFVLCAAPRRDILLGKNLAFAPFAFGLAAILLIILQVVRPLRLEHLLSMVPQSVSMFLLFCILMNLISICAPMPIAAGSLKPASPKLVPLFLQMIMFFFLFPPTQAVTLLPLGIEALLNGQTWTAGVPICLGLSLAECVAIVFVYRAALNGLARLFQAREQRILETVTNRGA